MSWRCARHVVRGAVLLALAAGCCPDAAYEAATPNPVVRLPQDESPHCSGGEWWYYTGRLTTVEGAGYGVEAVVFHVPAPPLVPVAQGWAAHFSVLDEATGAFRYEQERVFAANAYGPGEDGGFDLQMALVQMAGHDGLDHVRAAMADGAYAIDLFLEDERGPVLHGGGGYVPYGASGRSFYYSRPRMRATGTMEIAGRTHEVTGVLWFDRQWGRDLVNPWLAWDWFSLRLNDGTDVMLFVFRDTSLPVAFGTYVSGTGEAIPLAADEFAIIPTAWWTSPRTGAQYPVAWDVHIPSQDFVIAVTAVADDQEFDARESTLNIYWEGLCRVSGTRGGAAVAGDADVELTNYDRVP